MNEQPILPIGDIPNNFDMNPMIRRHGRGPLGRRCKTCKHMTPTSYHSARTYWKCARRGFSHGQGTDHRLKWAACRLYEQEEPDAGNE